MATWAEVVAEITFNVNKAAAAKQVEEAVAGAKPEANVSVNTGAAAEEVDRAVAEAHPVAKVGVDSAQIGPEVTTAVDEAHPMANVGVNEPEITEEVDQAVAAAHPTANVGVNEAGLTEEVDRGVAAAHPTANVGVDEPATGKAVSEAVEKAPPTPVPIDTSSTGRQVEEGLKSADTATAGKEGGEKYKGGFSAPVTALKGMVMGAVGAEAIMGGQQLFTSLIQNAGTAAKAEKVVTEAIKTTGGAAGVSAEQIEKMAGSQARATGVDKTAIEQSDALLTRYTNIKNAAGANNDIFNRTGQAALDMTAALNKGQVTEEGLTTTTKLLGKALDDPSKAAGALARSGVILDAQQKEQIKTFLKSNDTLDAQKVVLDAVNKSYGGTAANTASGTAKMKAALTELEEELGKNLLPLFSKLILGLTAVLDVLAPVAEWFNKGGTAAHIIEIALVSLVAAMTLYVGTVKTVEAATKAWAAAQALLDGELALNPIGLVVVAIAALIVGLVELYKHSQLFRDIVADIGRVLMAVVVGPFKAIIDAIHRVDDAIKDWIASTVATDSYFTGFFQALWWEISQFASKILHVFDPFVNVLRHVFDPFRDALLDIIGVTRELMAVLTAVIRAELIVISTVIKIQLAVIQAAFKAGAAILTGIWKAEWALMEAAVKTFGTVVLAILRTIIDTIRGVIKVGLDLMHGNWRQAWNDMTHTLRTVTGDWHGVIGQVTSYWRTAFSQAGNAVVGGFQSAWGALTGLARQGTSDIAGAVSALRGPWDSAWAAIRNSGVAALHGVESGVKELISIVTGLPGVFGSVAHGIGAAFDAIKSGIHDPIAWVVNNPINGMIKVFNTVGGSVHLPGIPEVHMAAAGMKITAGTTETADNVLVAVSKNETILSAAHSRFLAPVLGAIGVPGYARGGRPGYALGGLVHGIGRAAGDILSDAEKAVADGAKSAAVLAGQVYSDVIGGVVRVADKAIDAGQIAADLAVSKFDSLLGGFESLASMAAPGAEGWTKQATGAITHQLADASVGSLKGIAGVAGKTVAKVLDSGGWLPPGQFGYNGTSQPELFIPGMAAGGLLTGIPNLSGGLTISTPDGSSFQIPSIKDLQALAANNGQMTAHLQKIGQLLEQNPQEVANAIAQALNGVARLATAGAAYATR